MPGTHSIESSKALKLDGRVHAVLAGDLPMRRRQGGKRMQRVKESSRGPSC